MKAARRHEEAEEEPGGMERWLLTYSDMITLLLALFVVLYAVELEPRQVLGIRQGHGRLF